MIKNSFILLFLLFTATVNGQTEMLLGQISDRLVVRENFDKKGVFINKQTFSAGKIIINNGYYEIEVITELFDKDKKSTDKFTTIYRCKPDESSIMVMAFSFTNPKSKQNEINTLSKNFKKLYDFEDLKDIEMEISFDSGLLNFLGSKSIIKVYDRKLKNNKKHIQSKINMKAYAWGIRIKQLNYTVNEEFNEKGLLSFQEFNETDGSYFVLSYE